MLHEVLDLYNFESDTKIHPARLQLTIFTPWLGSEVERFTFLSSAIF